MGPEAVAHVVRRLGVGCYPELVAGLGDDVDAAVAAALDLSGPAPELPDHPPPEPGDPMQRGRLVEPWATWFGRLRAGDRIVEERLVWFWHDHFATSVEKVKEPSLLWRQQLTIRRHAAGSFRELLHAIAVDPAMLVYLDGVQNRAGSVNENYAREVMELHTLGRGNYTQDDVVALARACTGWVVPRGLNVPEGAEPYAATFVPRRHDDGTKTLLGTTGALDLDAAIDVLLDQPVTGPFVAAKLYEHLVGLPADEETAERLGRRFAQDWEILPLVERIAADPAFVSDEAFRAKVRTPLERAVTVAHAVPLGDAAALPVLRWLRTLGYVPFAPPNPAGFPDGPALLGPYQLVHALDLAGIVGDALAEWGALAPAALLARLGILEVSPPTLDALDAASDPRQRAALALACPEMAVT